MGILDDVLGAVSGAAGGGGKDQITGALGSLLGGGKGEGLTGLVESFTKNGLGDIIGSWISTGKNLPISPEQIMKGIGTDKLQGLASATGMSTDQLASLAAQILPGLIDKMTPDGKIPGK